MVFDNIFNFANQGAGLFSVTTEGTKRQPGADVDFEDSEEDTYDDKSTSLFNNAIHGASSRAKVVQEQSPEARAVLGFLGSFIQTTQTSAEAQAQYAGNASSVSDAASDGMKKASEKVREEDGLQKNKDLEKTPDKSVYAKAPKAPEAPRAAEAPAAPKPTAEVPKTLGETRTTEATAQNPSGSQ
ncbi:hypothetical protein BM536_008375 [Streptomyces phaeoluteigriseus]|uniref:Uncharacterized protein n=1 Tax=Streptomyces phaeoluteigriseus TaxID=114686 RepID=A0A1V6MW80_9ACTN|nr:hypothetical protein [Streptomyces phaeoluteigriseus]OQD56689.1 hypothetical protein BM536_008375 [Streptomyces phaeoluteigriseus]